jgi:hypothetical protein
MNGTGFRVCVRTIVPSSVPQGRLNFRLVQIRFLTESNELGLLLTHTHKALLTAASSNPDGSAALPFVIPRVCDFIGFFTFLTYLSLLFSASVFI